MDWLKAHGFVYQDGMWIRGNWRVYDYVPNRWYAAHTSATCRGCGSTAQEALMGLVRSLRCTAQSITERAAEIRGAADVMAGEVER